MNVRRFLLRCVALGSALLPLRGAVAVPIPPALRQTTNGESIRPTVAQSVEAGVTKLKSEDPAAQAEGRGELIENVEAGPAAPSAAYLNVYADVLNTELLKIANDEHPRVRLNVALVAAKVAEKANNPRLVSTVVDLLDDSNEGVVNWALKACKFLIGPAHTATGGPQAIKLMPAFVAAAKKYVASGPMIQIAYDSLRGVDTGNAPPAAMKAAVDAAQALLQERRNLYLKSIPEFAASENSVVTFLSGSRIWKAQSPAQQLATLQLLSDMTSILAQRFAVVDAIQRRELAEMIKNLGGALTVVGGWTDTQAKMDAFAKPLTKVSGIMPGDQVVGLSKAVYTGLTGIAQWKDLKPPPTIEK